MSNKVYDILKYLILIFVPALITFISGLGTILSFDTTTITAIIGLCATFIGSLVGISSYNYNKEDE